MEHLYEKALESAEYIKTHTKKRPKIAVVLGSGLGKLTADFTDTEELSYKDIPNFPVSTVAGHKGALLAGKLGDTEVYAMEGRFHFYEGYSMKEVCYPFYVFKLLGVEKVVLTNACGGIDREFAPGTLMLITDFINMMGTNPLIGPNDERFGPRFPDLTVWNCGTLPSRPPMNWALPTRRAFTWALWALAMKRRLKFAPLRGWEPMPWA